MKRVFLILLAIFLLLGASACNNGDSNGNSDGEKSVIVVDPNDPFTGVWTDVYGDNVMHTLYTFHGDGTGLVSITDIVYYFEYTYDETNLTLYDYPDSLDEPVIREYKYSIEGGELSLSNDSVSMVWYKQ